MARQHVSSADVTDAVIAEVEIGDATSEIVAAPTGGRAIRVLGYIVTASTATTVQWKSATTVKSGIMTVATGIAAQGNIDSRSFQCAPGQALNLTSTGAVTLGGHLTYQLVEPN